MRDLIPRCCISESMSECKAYRYPSGGFTKYIMVRKAQEVLERHFDHQLLQELLVPISDGDLGNVRNLSNLPLGLPLVRQHGGDVSGSRGYSGRSSPAGEFHRTSNLQNLDRNSLRLSRYDQFVRETGSVMPIGRGRYKHPQLSQHEPVAPSDVLLVQRRRGRYLI